MPIYLYKCSECNYEFEIMQKMNEPAPLCPECGERVDKQISRTSFVLGGEGWADQGYQKNGGKQ